ncbi:MULTISPECIES: ogr/Delta-like zinc finger family protein [Acinetobacter]|uniref:ogr/Delta-like zinc finger family protein n=1 Tax=Acinetobacter TaxID=469 RepID=UPI000518D3B8|nr:MULTISPECIES: ogr/Delta-like zinc finger family protein [Acinetobacter]MBJ8418758.1 ogr/Delta-like zinc finger family protein [Acinetobacter courvalinii]
MSKSIGFYCPHCDRRMHVTSRKKPSPLFHNIIVSCMNPDCLASFAADLEITRTIHNSLTPKPDLSLTKQTWENEIEMQLNSLELQPEIDQFQKCFVEGAINALFWTRKIDLAQAQTYRNRLLQMKLI